MVIARERLQASGIHLAISLCIASAAALLVFALWYPFPYREVSGGRELFLILAGVDVVVGPLITLAIYNRAKPRRELATDLAVIGVLQLVALAYGLWTVAVARPVHLVFEMDRLRVVHSIEIPQELLARTPPGIEAEPWTGPTPLAVRPFADERENFEATMQALQGVQIAARPDFWQPYDQARARILAAAKPLDVLKARPQQWPLVQAALERSGRDAAQTVYLPLVSRKLAWTALLDARTAQVVGFAPVDSF